MSRLFHCAADFARHVLLPIADDDRTILEADKLKLFCIPHQQNILHVVIALYSISIVL